MRKKIKLSFIKGLEVATTSSTPLIQVVLGPRQVGKTTGIHMYLSSIPEAQYHYVSADSEVNKESNWIEQQWQIARSKFAGSVLVIDEIQKVENWSEVVKRLWDSQANENQRIKLILLGSSSLEIQKGLSESLTGRFLLHRVFQWNFEESFEGYGLSFEDFLKHGGYPGSYQFLNDLPTWLNYLKNSIVETVIGKDILNLARVKSPALFHQSFYLAITYGAQEISYTKLLGQLQQKGNVELIKHYLELFEGAFLLVQLKKFSSKSTLKRSSSPKILPLAPALYSINKDADLNQEELGRAFEIAVGCELVRLPGELCYWRNGKFEVDYVFQFGKKVYAIEVKSGKVKKVSGLEKFKKEFPEAVCLILTPDNYRQEIKGIREAIFNRK